MTAEPEDGENDLQDPPILNQRISDLNLSARVRKRIALLGVETVEDLTRHSAAELRALRGFGSRSLNEVRESLLLHNLKLKND